MKPAASSHFPARIPLRVLGVGNAGCYIADQLARSGAPGAEIALVNTDEAALRLPGGGERFCFGLSVTRGLGAGGDPSQGRAAAESDVTCLRAFGTETRLLIMIVGLGGGAGTGGAPVIARLARESGALVLAVVTLPFDFEGNLRRANADAGLRELRACADAVIVLPSQALSRLLDERTPATEAFRQVAERVSQAVNGIWRLLTHPGLIPLDFGNLERLVRGRHVESSFATAMSQGENRAWELVERIARSPYLDEGRSLAVADGLLVSLAGGPDLTLAEIDRVSRELARRCREDVELTLGTTIDESLTGRLQLTVITCCRPAEPERTAGAAKPGLPPPEESAEEPPNTPSESATLSTRRGARLRDQSPPQQEALLARHRGNRRLRKAERQPELNLFSTAKGRFENTPATIHENENLDEPTFLRRNLVFN